LKHKKQTRDKDHSTESTPTKPFTEQTILSTVQTIPSTVQPIQVVQGVQKAIEKEKLKLKPIEPIEPSQFLKATPSKQAEISSKLQAGWQTFTPQKKLLTKQGASISLDSSLTPYSNLNQLHSTKNAKQKPKFLPSDRGYFESRVASFSSVVSWFAKPLVLNPLQCAMYGWINLKPDVLKCENCSAQLVYPFSFENHDDPEKVLNDGHKQSCAWRDGPKQLDFVQISPERSEEMIFQFHNRYNSLVHFDDKEVTEEWLKKNITYTFYKFL